MSIPASKRYVIPAVAAAAVAVVLVALAHGGLDGHQELVNILLHASSDFVVTLVIILLVAGVVSAAAFLWYIKQERDDLKENGKGTPWLYGPDHHGGGWRAWAFQLLHHCRCTGTYLNLLEMMPAGPHTLHYLHRTADHLARFSPAATCVRILTQVLLIVGICGTLLGVYGALAKGTTLMRIETLAPVLMPGCAAIIATVIMLGLRYYCRYSLRSYLSKLDKHGMSREINAAKQSEPQKLINELQSELSRVLDPVASLSFSSESLKEIQDATDSINSTYPTTKH